MKARIEFGNGETYEAQIDDLVLGLAEQIAKETREIQGLTPLEYISLVEKLYVTAYSDYPHSIISHIKDMGWKDLKAVRIENWEHPYYRKQLKNAKITLIRPA